MTYSEAAKDTTSCFGGKGDDTLIGGKGNDTMSLFLAQLGCNRPSPSDGFCLTTDVQANLVQPINNVPRFQVRPRPSVRLTVKQKTLPRNPGEFGYINSNVSPIKILYESNRD